MAHISNVWQWRGVNKYPGMTAAQPMRRWGLTAASLPSRWRAQIRETTMIVSEKGDLPNERLEDLNYCVGCDNYVK